ncbi:formate dehydrogenase accessory sulfurtransferase FdhD [Bosea sp. (in: a-proteobacteria)]|uniref:formate dehydrogenase accessory sulfurtransferase FdhD n=1 Tax=Bosea sp. (in: a-proteobacteria) TaxID=1871050 RepID=UPI0025C133DE|nr:formate dehydrogenase accessory sulfurtransferase FdhD [Bosea sp. (in: a-proteobacteria)]
MEGAREIEVAVETPINIVYGNMPYAVMMASPSDLEDFVAGFSLTEGIVRGADEIRGIAVEPKDEGVIVTVELAPGRFREHLARRRNLSGRTRPSRRFRWPMPQRGLHAPYPPRRSRPRSQRSTSTSR